jgi:glycine/D-amino acid oxidase-like deaminating enzyme
MYKLAIVGLGPAGIFALAHLPPEMLKDVIVFEPSAVGGALATEYSAVVANIPKSFIVTAFCSIPRWSALSFKHLDKYADDACPLLGDVVKQLRELIAPDLRAVAYHSERVTSFNQENKVWKLKTLRGNLFEVQKLIMATGAAPKILDLPKPIIPLHVALTPQLLESYVTSNDRVVVFGTAHSGTLALHNLRNAGVKNLIGIFKGEKPFFFARDGFSEGIKQESAAIADDLLAKGWAHLISFTDFPAAHRAVCEATTVVYAMGFERGVALPAGENVWGFGIGYPSSYTGPDGQSYPDVGFGGFISAINEALPSLLTFDS